MGLIVYTLKLQFIITAQNSEQKSKSFKPPPRAYASQHAASNLALLISHSSRAWVGGKRTGGERQGGWCINSFGAQLHSNRCHLAELLRPLPRPLSRLFCFIFLLLQSALPSNTVFRIQVCPWAILKGAPSIRNTCACPRWVAFIRETCGTSVHLSAICPCVHLVHHQCQAWEWETLYKCCLSGGRRPSPRGFNHTPHKKPPPPRILSSFHQRS